MDEFEYEPVESSESAKTQRILLRNPRVEFGQSIFSCRLEDYVIPNRDYHYEGLTAIVNNENWKFLDGIGFKVENFFLQPIRVRVLPWQAVYEYCFDKNRLKVRYSLLENGLKLTFSADNPQKISLTSLIDLRHVHDESRFEKHIFSPGKKILKVAKDEKELFIIGVDTESIEIKRQHWRYKLGTGFRKKENSNVFFQPEERYVARVDGLKLNKNEILILCNTQNPREEAPHLNDLLFLNKYSKFFSECYGEFYGRAFLGRAYCLLHNFNIFFDNLLIPDAGFGWFREIWFRDCFEGMYNNFHVYYNYNKGHMKKIIVFALNSQNTSGLIPTMLREKPVYNSIDTTLLCFLTAFKYIKSSRDAEFKKFVLEKAKKFLEGVEKQMFCRVSSEKLLLTSCDASWTDSKINNMSTRLPEGWAPEKYYYLIEINALWIRFLSGLGKDVSSIKENFKKIFFHNDILCDIVSENMKRNCVENSLGIVAFPLLPNLFSEEECLRLFSRIQTHFMYRNEKLFGLILRNVGEKTYLNDEQYHGYVFWPRDLPYFIRFLLRIGKGDLVEEILVNILEHQMNEGTIFYTQELFSPPLNDPVPVKNPAQYWSQFVEPFIWFYNWVNKPKRTLENHGYQ